MKKHSLILFTLSLLLVSGAAFGQLSKDEKKEWKNKAKEYKKNPELLKEFTEEKQAAENQVNRLKTEVNNLQSTVSDKDARISEMQDQVAKLKADLAATNAKLKSAMEQERKIGVGGEMTDGVVFKVQIGAFRNKDLSKYFEQHENFGGETVDGQQRITLGQFRDYWEADTFKKYLREMGVKDAWIVPYKDGQRVPLKDVLEGVITSEDGTE